jgi:hypothetical protein
MSIVDQIGLENVLNAILVKENVRPAMLVQPADNDEATGRDPKTKSIVDALKQTFPDLSQSENYNIYQGIILSKTNYNGINDISLEKMGKILGYPCYRNFTMIDPEKTSYEINVFAHVKTPIGSNKIHLFANVCEDMSKINMFNKIVEKAKAIFAMSKYAYILGDMTINDVTVEINTILSTQSIIDKLIEHKPIEQSDIDKIQNILFNFGFSMELQFYFLDKFQYNNPIHIGILLDLLVREKNDTLSPFFPLQKYPEQNKAIDNLTEKWEKSILEILEKTKSDVQQKKRKCKCRRTHRKRKHTAQNK